MIEKTGKKATTLHKSLKYLNFNQSNKNSGNGCFSFSINTTVQLEETILQAY